MKIERLETSKKKELTFVETC